ncbi:MAG: hypothetical protein ACT4QC_23250 [Planctomycetaceae bacterium]
MSQVAPATQPEASSRYNDPVTHSTPVSELPGAAAPSDFIRVRGARIHNLKNIDLDVPLGRLIAVTGVSGAGKSSLAFDTLYAEAQRRFVESLPAGARQFLERFEPPQADEIGPLPPAIAVRRQTQGASQRATLGSLAELLNHLHLLYSRLGITVCPDCRMPVIRYSAVEIADKLEELPAGTRYQLGFRPAKTRQNVPEGMSETPAAVAARLARGGFARFAISGRSMTGAELSGCDSTALGDALAIVDRLQSGITAPQRLIDSIETTLRHGQGCCVALIEDPPRIDARPAQVLTRSMQIDNEQWVVKEFFDRLVCEGCGREFSEPVPGLFDFKSPLGACSHCHGSGVVAATEVEPSAVTSRRQRRSLRPPCPACRGNRLNSDALAVRLAGCTLPELTGHTLNDLRIALRSWETGLAEDQRASVRHVWHPLEERLDHLIELGLGHVAVGRPAATLSRGEAQRARLAGAIGGGLEGLLYILDEPTAGLHACERDQLRRVLHRLRDAGNTVLVIEHDQELVESADWLVDLGPQAGRAGGQIVYAGPPAGIASASESATARFFARPSAAAAGSLPRSQPEGWLRIEGISHRNLRDVAVDFPLGVLCAVTGVSGSGKSSLIEETLYPALTAALAGPHAAAGKVFVGGDAGRFTSLSGFEQLGAVAFLDQSPAGRSPRSVPASVLGILSEIRTLFAATAEAKVRNYAARHFSLSAANGGRCQSCAGAGEIAVDMQFLPDATTPCPDCHGRRFRPEVLAAKYRGLSIAHVLDLSAQEAFLFFRGQTRLQRRLKFLKETGLDYLTLGQPTRLLSGGEAQRLKMAAFLARSLRTKTLFILDEPTVGLHPQNVASLLACWRALLAAGHSLIVIEHNLEIICAADYVIDLGPGAGPAGGQVVSAGTPEEVAGCASSATGRRLASCLGLATAGGRANARDAAAGGFFRRSVSGEVSR